MRLVKIKILLPALFVLGLAAGASGWLGQVGTVFARALNIPNSATKPFLYPPYPGTGVQVSFVDHTSPYYTDTDNKMVIFTSDEANKHCPLPRPKGTPPPQNGVCDSGWGIYWSYGLGQWLSYNGHDGIDYGISYRPLYAAAASDKVVYAGWHSPQNHSYGLGLYVKLQHDNGYSTVYGHMSAVAVQTCGLGNCQSLAQGEMIGISGNTGNSTGPHLHFRVSDAFNRAVDPYGWKGKAGTDPLSYNQSTSLWIQNPSVVSYSGSLVLPTGPELDYPAPVTSGTIIDDTDIRFDETPDGCWARLNTGAGLAQNNNMRYVSVRTSGGDTCIARWDFPGLNPGLYAVYIRIPSVYATSQGAQYKIVHNGQTHTAIIYQEVFPNANWVRDGWVYAGEYEFSASGEEYVQLGNRTYDESAKPVLGVDAVRFVNLGDIPPTVTPTITPSPTITLSPTVTRTPTITRTPTVTRTPTITRTPTLTRTPTITRTPTKTRTPSITPSVRPTDTRWPTATPPYTKVNIYFADRFKLASNTTPYLVNGYRYFKSSLNLPEEVLKTYFKGPGYTEFTWGYITLYDGFTGFSSLEVADGVAHVYLTGACDPARTDFTIADLLSTNLKQFDSIQYVKVYDQTGSTQSPSSASDSIPACLTGTGPTVTPTLTPTLTPKPGITVTPTRTPSITSTSTKTTGPTPTHTRRPTATPTYIKTNVYWVSNYRMSNNIQPYEVAGERWISTSGNVPLRILNIYFQGPGATEKYSYGWIAIYSGFTGVNKLEVIDGVAHVYLTGACNPGTGYTIVGPLNANLKQFSEIQFVKIYDENGSTQSPTGAADSIPSCLSGTGTSVPGPATRTSTPTPTATRTFTPTSTRTPTRTPVVTGPTPSYVKQKVYWVSTQRLNYGWEPYEVAGERWASTAGSLPEFVLKVYFGGPGSVERWTYGWIAIYSGFDGFSKLEIIDGVAHVYLTGACNPGTGYTIVRPLNANLKQFPEIQFVKIYDENGTTQSPTGQSDSIPACLQP